MVQRAWLEAYALLYIPSKAPFDLYSPEMKRGLQLYVKRVFVMDECRDLLPPQPLHADYSWGHTDGVWAQTPDRVYVIQQSELPVLENPVGFNIFKVNDRKPERAYELDEVRSQLQSAVEEIKDHDRWEVWIKALRGKSHVEIRGS